MYVSKENLKIKTKEETDKVGIYEFEPLPTGFGHTLANALRRILLTSISGAAATEVRIKGITHQFSTIKGIKEDIVQITLNLKKIRFKLHTNNPVVGSIKVKGKGEITAEDIELSSDAEVMNKDQHIATIADDKTTLEMELVIEPGTGYSPMEERKTSKVGVIVLDSLFSPITNVTYNIENTRFGERADLDKITLIVETDGSIAPKEAVQKASEIARDYYDSVVNWKTEGEAPEATGRKGLDMSLKADEVMIEELPLQTRTINALKKSGIKTLEELGEKTNEEVADIKNIGEKSLEEIMDLLEQEGLR